MNTRVLSLLLFTLVSLAAMFVWFIQRAPVLPPPVVAKAPLAAAPPPVALLPKADAVEEPRHYRPKPVTEAVRRKVDDFIRRYKDMSPEELNKNEEFSGMLEGFLQMMSRPEFQHKMEERIAVIQAAKGMKHGTLNIGFGKLESPESRAWLEAVFSEDTERMEEFVMNKLDGAIFEFAFDPAMEKTSDGVTVKGSEAPPAPSENKLPD